MGRIPYGLTYNEVFATIDSILRDRVPVESVTKRKLSGNMVSIIAVYEAPSATSAVSEANYAAHAVTNFSYDLVWREHKA